MPEAIAYEDREHARELYILEGLTLEKVAAETGIAMGNLERWSAEDGWVEDRKKYRANVRDIRRNTVALSNALLRKAIDSLDPQDAYAAARLGVLAQRETKSIQEKKIDIDRPALFLQDLEFIAETLKEIDPEGLKILARNFENIVKRFKEQHAAPAA